MSGRHSATQTTIRSYSVRTTTMDSYTGCGSSMNIWWWNIYILLFIYRSKFVSTAIWRRNFLQMLNLRPLPGATIRCYKWWTHWSTTIGWCHHVHRAPIRRKRSVSDGVGEILFVMLILCRRYATESRRYCHNSQQYVAVCETVDNETTGGDDNNDTGRRWMRW